MKHTVRKSARGLGMILLTLLTTASYANYLLVPMDDRQANHLKTYGIAYSVLHEGLNLDWLFNYRFVLCFG